MKKLFGVLFTLFSCVVLADKTSQYYEQALFDFAQGDFARAEISVKNSIKENDRYLPARILLGDILLQRGLFAAAEKELTIALQLNGDSQAVILPLARAKSAQGKHQETIELMSQYPQLEQQEGFFYILSASYRDLKQFDLAKKTLERALLAHGETEQTFTGLAELHFLKSERTKAQSLLNKALAIDKTHLPAQMLQAELYKLDNKHDRALTVYNDILANDPNNHQALFGKAYVYLKQNQLKQALDISLQLRKLFPEDPYGKLLHLAITSLDGQHQQSKTLLRDIQQQLRMLDTKQRKEQQVLLLSASVDLINENFNQARKHFTEYLGLYGENLVARRHLASIELKQGNFASARNHIDKALAMSQTDVDIYLLAIEIYQRQGFIGDYQQLVDKTFQLFPQHMLVKGLYVSQLISKNNIESALEVLASADKLRDQTLLGYLQLQANQLESSLQTTRQLLEAYPNKVEILHLAGELSLKLGHGEDAQAFFQQSLTLAPEFRPALLALAGMALNQQDSATAIGYYQRLLTAQPNDALVLQLYADIAIKQQQYALAIKLLSAVERQDNAYAQAQRVLLTLYIETQQFQQADMSLAVLEQYFSFDQEILLAKSKLLIKTQRVLAAQKSLKVLFGLTYDHAKKLEAVALLQLEAKDIDGAQRSIERIEQLVGNTFSPYLWARFYLETNEFKRLQTLLDQQLVSTDKRYIWQELQVHLLIKQNKLNAAIATLAPLYKQTQQRSHLQLLARLYSQTQQLTPLIAVLKGWVLNMPYDSWAVSQLSALAQASGDIQLAVSTLENYPDLENNPIFLNNLANFYLDIDASKGLAYAESAYQLAPHNAAINDTLGWSLVMNNQFKQGLYYLREASSRDINNATYHYHLAYVLAKLKRIELAQSSYQKALSLKREHALSVAVEKQLLLASTESAKSE